MKMFRKWIALLCTLALLLGCVAPVAAMAEDTEDGTVLTWSLTGGEDGEAVANATGMLYFTLKSSKLTVAGYSGNVTTVKIPSKVNGYSVIAIGASAFADTGVKVVTVPSSVTKIYKLAFANTDLTKITLTKKITSIASTAFKNATVGTFSAPSGSYAYKWGVSKGFIGKTTTGNYKALLIGEYSFVNYSYSYGYYWDYTQRNVEDANNMETMLKSVYGPTGKKYSITKATDASKAKIKSLIKSTFSGATSSDTCLFFIATHGDSSADGELAMPFLGTTTREYEEFIYSSDSYLPFSDLASWLKTYCAGPVVVIIESCGSGSAIYSPSEENDTLTPVSFENAMETISGAGEAGGLLTNTPGAAGVADDELIKTLSGDPVLTEKDKELIPNFDPASFVDSAISAFRTADPGIVVEEGVDFDEELEAMENSTGDLRVKNKFYVLAASRHREMSWGREDGSDSYNYFTKWLIDGIGSYGNSPADTNDDSVLTLKELFNYLKQYNDYSFYSGGQYYYQHAQVYPVNSSYKVFLLK